MKIVNPFIEYIPQEFDLQSIYKKIEYCGKVCYKSENNITENSAENFINRIKDSGHLSVLEHGTVYLNIPYGIIHRLTHPGLCKKYLKNPYTKVYKYEVLVPSNQFLVPDIFNTYLAVTTNYRVIFENGWEDDLKYLCYPTQFHEKRYTVKCITDRGVTHELVRHRHFSFSQESSRYCNYSKNKFGEELTYIEPSFKLNTIQRDIFISHLEDAESHYMAMLNAGCKPEEARQILPTAVKSEICITAFESDWTHFFNLRYFETTGKTHPNCKEIAMLIYNKFKENGFV